MSWAERVSTENINLDEIFARRMLELKAILKETKIGEHGFGESFSKEEITALLASAAPRIAYILTPKN